LQFVQITKLLSTQEQTQQYVVTTQHGTSCSQ